jgi:AraC-like DNA-binding protein
MNVLSQGGEGAVPIATIDLVLRTAGSIGVDLNSLLEDARINSLKELGSSPSSLQRIAPIYRQCVEALVLHVYSQDGLTVCDYDAYDEAELFCRCALSSENLEDAIRRSIKFNRALGGRAGALSLQSSDEKAVLFMDTSRSGMPGLVLDMLELCAYYKIYGWLIGESLNSSLFTLAHDMPLGKNVCEEIVDCPIVFDGDRNYFSFKKALLKRPVVRKQAELADIFRWSGLNLLSMVLKAPLSARIERHLRKCLSEKAPAPSMEAVARLFCQSASTLRRNLLQENTSFQELLDKVRVERSMDLLRKTGMTFDDIAQDLGFSDSGCFYRAFKHWTGLAPSECRKHAGVSQK